MSNLRLKYEDISCTEKGWYELTLSNSDITISLSNFLIGFNENEDLLDFCLFNNIQGNIDVENPADFLNNIKKSGSGVYKSFIDYDMINQTHYGVNINIDADHIIINQIKIKYDEVLVQDIIDFFDIVLSKWYYRINKFALQIVQNSDSELLQKYHEVFVELCDSDYVSEEFIEEYGMFI